jgi:hypothetical protein
MIAPELSSVVVPTELAVAPKPDPKPAPKPAPTQAVTASSNMAPRKLDYGYRAAFPNIGANTIFELNRQDPEYNQKSHALNVKLDEVLVFHMKGERRQILKIPKDALMR